LKTTVTLNTGDKLATSATAANVSYYVFEAATGKYLKEGTTSAGTASFTVPTAGNYKMILYKDTAGTSVDDYLAQEVTFSTDGDDPTGRADKTVNVDLYKESNATINSVQDPVDLNANVSAGLGQTAAFNILISATSSKAAVNQPIIRAVVNNTVVDDVMMPALEEVACPQRLTLSTEQQQYCFKYGQMVAASEGIKSFSGSILMDGSTAKSASEHVSFTVLDTGLYLESDYKTKGYAAFKYGAENPVGNAEVGAQDSTAKLLGLQG
jgi:hypothetical protein